MCSGSINNFISCHTHPPRGSPYCGKMDLWYILATFLFQMSNQNFTFFFFFFFFSSSFAISNYLSSSLLCHTNTVRFTTTTDFSPKNDTLGKPHKHSRKINGKVKLTLFFPEKSNGYHTFFAWRSIICCEDLKQNHSKIWWEDTK